MRIAITSEGPSLDARIDGRFGRCRYFLIVNTDDLSFEVIENHNAALGGGAGIQSAQMVADREVTHVFTGACGPNAYQVLSAAGIEVVTGCSGMVTDVVDQFRNDSYRAAKGPNVADHYGMGQNFSAQSNPRMGSGPGFTPGMGRGGGMGMGRGGGMGGFAGSQAMDTQNTREAGEDELETLKRRMDQISKRISELEKKKGATEKNK